MHNETKEPIRTYDLEIDYDSAKSFYGKAEVEKYDDHKVLKSYGEPVLSVDEYRNVTRLTDNVPSATTVRHMKEFLKQEIGPMSYSYISGRTDKEKMMSLPVQGEDVAKSIEDIKKRHSQAVHDNNSDKDVRGKSLER